MPMSITYPARATDQAERLPCGCRRDARYICPEHTRAAVARWITGELARLLALSLFMGTLGLWAAILNIK